MHVEAIRKTVTSLVCLFLFFSTLTSISVKALPNCCNGKVCPMHLKHSVPANNSRHSHMDCEHEESGLPSCSMSCGHTEDAGPQNVAPFILPNESQTFELLDVQNALLHSPATSLEFSIGPLTPPPRP
jgi:hypothetical protein